MEIGREGLAAERQKEERNGGGGEDTSSSRVGVSGESDGGRTERSAHFGRETEAEERESAKDAWERVRKCAGKDVDEYSSRMCNLPSRNAHSKLSFGRFMQENF